MTETIWSLIPPLLAIVMVLLTRRVLLSLGVGIIASALFVAQFHLLDSFGLVIRAFARVFYTEEGLNMWNIYIMLFIFILGIMTTFVGIIGGTRAFGDFMIKRVKTRKGAQLMTMSLGIALFIDDYFNSLAVGQVARPVTDKHRISRAKLAYIVDSTAAPVCVIAPVSSWGAYIIGLIGVVLTTHQITDLSAFNAFLYMIPMNFYVWAALGVVFIIAIRQSDFGAMKRHELHAIQTGEVQGPNTMMPMDTENESLNNQGKLTDLILPILVLLFATIGFIYWTGYNALGTGEKSLIQIFGEADVSLSLFWGGFVALITTFLLSFKYIANKSISRIHFSKGVINGLTSMLPAVIILIFAWTITDLIDQLGTGVFLADVVKNSNISFSLLPLIIFVIAGLIAFSTGTSWGSFALLLPIAGQIAAATHIELILPMLASVLAGAVFGDHCSPISDTTILSSTGSNCNHIDHVVTQLPYAIVAAIIAGAGYLALGITGNVYLGLLAVLIGLIMLSLLLKKPARAE